MKPLLSLLASLTSAAVLSLTSITVHAQVPSPAQSCANQPLQLLVEATADSEASSGLTLAEAVAQALANDACGQANSIRFAESLDEQVLTIAETIEITGAAVIDLSSDYNVTLAFDFEAFVVLALVHPTIETYLQTKIPFISYE